MKKILYTLLFSCMTIFMHGQEVGLKIGDIAPELAYENPKGTVLALSELKGKLVPVSYTHLRAHET